MTREEILDLLAVRILQIAQLNTEIQNLNGGTQTTVSIEANFIIDSLLAEFE